MDTKRVKAVIPMVIQVLKTVPTLEHLFNSLCRFPEAMHDYASEGVTELLLSDGFKKLTDIIDPFVYRDRIANTRKYIINSLGDQFFWPGKFFLLWFS